MNRHEFLALAPSIRERYSDISNAEIDEVPKVRALLKKVQEAKTATNGARAVAAKCNDRLRSLNVEIDALEDEIKAIGTERSALASRIVLGLAQENSDIELCRKRADLERRRDLRRLAAATFEQELSTAETNARLLGGKEGDLEYHLGEAREAARLKIAKESA